MAKSKFLGRKVSWTSQAKGTAKTKTGTVVEVVKEFELPKTKGFRLKGRLSRAGVSYLIKTENGQLYWPRVSALIWAPTEA